MAANWFGKHRRGTVDTHSLNAANCQSRRRRNDPHRSKQYFHRLSICRLAYDLDGKLKGLSFILGEASPEQSRPTAVCGMILNQSERRSIAADGARSKSAGFMSKRQSCGAASINCDSDIGR